MVKPIFTVGFPSRTTIKEALEMRDNIKTQVSEEYYVIIYIQKNDSEEVKFEVFYEKDFNVVRYEELIEIIRKKNKW